MRGGRVWQARPALLARRDRRARRGRRGPRERPAKWVRQVLPWARDGARAVVCVPLLLE
jgi:hypothetical protein